MACEFQRFLSNLSKNGNAGAKLLLERSDYLVDRFHIRGHTQPQCDISRPECSFHPDLPKFATIANANTSCAEQCFSWLKKFKNTSKYMSAYKFKFFLKVIVRSKNEFTEKSLTKKGLLVS